MVKICPKCRITKSLKEFGLRKKGKERYQWACKKCHCIASRENYQKNKDRYKFKARKWDKKRINLLQKFVWEYLLIHPCIDCGETDIVVLQFDHLGNKLASIAHMIIRKYSLKHILEEIEKCEVRCANCHMRKTAKQFNWAKLDYALEAQLDEQKCSKLTDVSSNLTESTK